MTCMHGLQACAAPVLTYSSCLLNLAGFVQQLG